MKKAKFNPSKTVVIVTITCLIISFGCLYMFFITGTVSRFVFLATTILLWIPVLWAPLCTQYSDDEIIVKRLIGEKKLKLSDYNLIPIESKEMSGSIRTFGSGGLFGYFGWFYSKKMGKYYAMLLSMTNLLMLVNKENQKKYVINNPFSDR